jgi:hypothetical protein
MNQKFKLNPNTILMLIIFGMVFIVNIFSLLSDFTSSKVTLMQSYRDAVLPVNILDLVKFTVVFFMIVLAFKLVKKGIKKENQSSQYYRGMKQIGWLSVLVVLLDAISFVLREQYISQNKDIATISTNPTIYADIISRALFSSPITWFLIVCIFLAADAVYENDLRNRAK